MWLGVHPTLVTCGTESGETGDDGTCWGLAYRQEKGLGFVRTDGLQSVIGPGAITCLVQPRSACHSNKHCTWHLVYPKPSG